MSLCGVRVLTPNLIIVLPPHAVMTSPLPWCCQCPGGVPLRSPHHGYPHSAALAPAAHCLWTPVAPQLAPDVSAPAFLPCYPRQGPARRLQAGSPTEHCHWPVLGSSDACPPAPKLVPYKQLAPTVLQSISMRSSKIGDFVLVFHGEGCGALQQSCARQ
jgi:hypothetical protein